ncbi:MAG: hypothetical protein NTZ16_06535 [Verrucomicrobia bacterium]|nr:hypothetical protein [Verrucomicrobiota bacterium]
MRFAICAAVAAAALSASNVSAQTTNVATHLIDLPTALKLAGAQNLDVQIAGVLVTEAKANQQSAIAQFFPWLAPGVSAGGFGRCAVQIARGAAGDRRGAARAGIAAAGQRAGGGARLF